MGGAVKHLSHPYDDRELTLGSLKVMLIDASSGHLEQVTEKFDGMNLVFTWNVAADDLRVARAVGDIKRGGMNASALAEKFANRANVADAFNSAFAVLNKALQVLSKEELENAFGAAGNKWYSIEVVYTQNQNVISYDNDSIVFHGWPAYEVDYSTRTVQNADSTAWIDTLKQQIEQMRASAVSTGWRIMSPLLVRLKNPAPEALAVVLSTINAVMHSAGLSDNDTIEELLIVRTMQQLNKLDVPETLQHDLACRILGVSGAPTVTAIKKTIASDSDKLRVVNSVYQNAVDIMHIAIDPLERAIRMFSIELLRGLKSALVADAEKEITRLRRSVQTATSAIKVSHEKRQMLAYELSRLDNIEDVSAALEGVVFMHAGKAYKFTGSFAPMNKILGVFRYS